MQKDHITNPNGVAVGTKFSINFVGVDDVLGQ
jgi:hypothetical protein